jgi:hypothetical protein
MHGIPRCIQNWAQAFSIFTLISWESIHYTGKSACNIFYNIGILLTQGYQAPCYIQLCSTYICVCVCIVSDVIIVHMNCIELSSFFLYTPKKLATTQ